MSPVTRDTMNAGSMAFRYVVAIEGYPYLLTNANPAEAVGAWTGSDWTAALGGLFVELDNEQRLNPWEPLQPGGRCMLRVVQTTPGDEFGVDTHKRNAGAESELTATADRTSTVLYVKSAAAFASSGNVYCGTECIAYTGKVGNSLTVGTRGKFSPFANGAGGRFAEHHRVGLLTSNGPNLQPLVTAQRRVWKGAWVGVWMHAVVGGTMVSLSQAELVYAGRLVSIGDDPATMSTTVEIKHVLDVVAEGTVGRELWSAKANGGLMISLSDNRTCRMVDTKDNGTTWKYANNLVIASGTYTHAQLFALLEAWWDAELAALRIAGTYRIGQATTTESGDALRTKIYWQFPSTGTHCQWYITMPFAIAKFFGFDENSGGVTTQFGRKLQAQGPAADVSGAPHHYVSSKPPLQLVYGGALLGSVTAGLTVREETGTFSDQYSTLPPLIQNQTIGAGAWGVFRLGAKYFVGRKNGTAIDSISSMGSIGDAFDRGALVDFPTGMNIPISQVFVVEAKCSSALAWFLSSTGTPGHNGTNDVLPFGLGLGLPGALLPALASSALDIPGADAAQLIVIDKTMKFAELFRGDLILRGAFLRWKLAGLQLGTWQTPSAGAAIATLNEGTKAAPSGTQDEHRTASLETDQWSRSVIKIEYNRDARSVDASDGYASSITYEDRVAIDDSGGEGSPVSIKARNTYGEYSGQGAAIEALAPYVLSRMPLLSRSVNLQTRSIDQRFWLSICVGDIVLTSDAFARDPDTGRRGVATRPAYVTKHRWNPGGLSPKSEKPNDMAGEVELLLLDQDRVATYVPSALVASYDAPSRTLTCVTHEYSLAFDPSDATRFPIGTLIRIIEIDPANPAAPLSWDVTVTSQSINTITVGTVLTGYDATKSYRVVWVDYAAATAAQQLYCYQADDTSGLVASVAAPRQYATGTGDSYFLAAPGNQHVELIPDLARGDGRGRDVGHETALARLCNQLIDYRTAHSSPQLQEIMSAPGGVITGGTWLMVHATPIWLTYEGLSAGVARSLQVAPWFRSKTAGLTAQVRVTLTRSPPANDTLIDVDRGTNPVSSTFSSTVVTWGSPTAVSMPIAPAKLSNNGMCWLLIEVNVNAETRGLAICREGARNL